MPKHIDSISRQPKKTDVEGAPESDKPADVVPPPPSSEPAKTDSPTPAETPQEASATLAAAPASATPAESKPADSKAGEATPEGTPPSTPATPGDSFDNLFPEPSIVMTGPPGWVWWVLLVVGAAGLGFLAYDLTRGKIDQWLSVSPTPTPAVATSTSPTPSPTEATTDTPTPEASTTPSPTSTGTVAKSAITLRVLNGTKTTGAASTYKTSLEKAGFTVRTIGNAKTQNYTQTMVYYTAGHQAEAELVKESLPSGKGTLEESTVASPDMVLVVVGSN